MLDGETEILAHQIIDVHHVPRCLNVVADSLSQANEGMAHEDGDGSRWTVSKEWEAMTGLTHDIFFTTNVLTPKIAGLRELSRTSPCSLKL